MIPLRSYKIVFLYFLSQSLCYQNFKFVSPSALKHLKKSANKTLREASTFALWELEGRRKQKPGHRTEEPGTEPEPSMCRDKVPHVMLSYQWNSQKLVLQIRDELVKAGYKVWMDVDKMSEY